MKLVLKAKYIKKIGTGKTARYIYKEGKGKELSVGRKVMVRGKFRDYHAQILMTPSQTPSGKYKVKYESGHQEFVSPKAVMDASAEQKDVDKMKKGKQWSTGDVKKIDASLSDDDAYKILKNVAKSGDKITTSNLKKEIKRYKSGG